MLFVVSDVGSESSATSSVDKHDFCAEYVESLLSDKKFLDEMRPRLIDIMKRLNNFSDFSSKLVLDDLQFLFSNEDPKRKSRSGKVGDILASSGLAQLFRHVFDKHFKKEFVNDGRTDLKYHMKLMLYLMWHFSYKSKLMCVKIF